MSLSTSQTIPAKHGTAIQLPAHQTIKIHNTYGNQVVDTWAFTTSKILTPKPPSSYMSMSQTRSALHKIRPQINDTLVTNHCQPILTLLEDTSGGVHDTLFPACNPQRYSHLQVAHRSCAENCREAAVELGIEIAEGDVPDPLNLFMSVEVEFGEGKRGIELREPVSGVDSYVVLRAEADCVVVLSACPNDITLVNGMKCRDVLVEVL